MPAQGLCPPAEAARMIRDGRILVLAGAEADLASLPEGCWIGGTVGYFATPQGGVAAGGQVYYADFTPIAAGAEWRRFTAQDIHEIGRHYPANGFAILLLPGFSELLGLVAGRIMAFEGLYNQPLMGWVSAVGLHGMPDILPPERPKIFAGGPRAETECAAVLYVSLPDSCFAQLHIANIFAPGEGPPIRFLAPGQSGNGDCLIGGVPRNLARYIAEQGIDPRLPLVADHEGALVNASLLMADAPSGRVMFLSPVSPALTYRFAGEVADYKAQFARAAAEIEPERAAHACVCTLHYHYAGFIERHDRPHAPARGIFPGLDITAPMTFGQIAYTVLTQTLTCLMIGQYEEEEPEEFAP